MDEATLRKILKSHEEWLDSSGKDGEPADFCEADLRGVDLRVACLREAILSDADLRNADLRGTNLSIAYMCRADLRRASLAGASMGAAVLHKADLRNAYLAGADLQGVNLRDADLRDADLRGADLRYADLRGANLQGANLLGTDLYGANMSQKVVQIGPIGSRNDYTVYRVEEDIVQCGCWREYAGGALADFIARVNETYPEGNEDGAKYRREYLAAIAMFQALREDYLKNSRDKKRITKGECT